MGGNELAVIFCLLLVSTVNSAICNKCKCFLGINLIVCHDISAEEAEVSLGRIRVAWAKILVIKDVTGVFDMDMIQPSSFVNLQRVVLQGNNFACAFIRLGIVRNDWSLICKGRGSLRGRAKGAHRRGEILLM